MTVPIKRESDRHTAVDFPPSSQDREPLLGNRSDDDADGGKAPHKATALQAFFNLAKASIGAGSFALPWALAQAGLGLGILGLIVISLLSLYTMRMLVQTKRRVNEHALQDGLPEANSLAEVAQRIAPRWGYGLVQFFVIGVAAGYLIFIGLNLRAALLNLFGLNWRLLDWYIVILPVVVLMTFLPSFKHLAKAAYLGSIFLVFAMVFTYISGAQNGHFQTLASYPFAIFDTFFRFFGTALFLFGVHTMVIPLEQGLAIPNDINKVLGWGCSTVLGSNLPFAIFGYLAFGGGVSDYVFCSLPHNTFLSLLQLSLSLELILSVPIVLMPANQAVEETLSLPPAPRSTSDHLKRCSIRALLVLGAWGFAVAIPLFGTVLSLVGGFACAAIAFVIPPLFDLMIRFSARSSGAALGGRKPIQARDVAHAAIMLFGLAALVITTVMTIQDIVHMFKTGQVHPVYQNVSDAGTCK